MPRMLKERYLLRKEIAQGGMSTVWEALDTGVEDTRRVAVKILHADKDLRRFNSLSYDREVEAYSRLSHKNVLRIFDHGISEEDERYLVLEWMSVDLERHRDNAHDTFKDCVSDRTMAS